MASVTAMVTRVTSAAKSIDFKSLAIFATDMKNMIVSAAKDISSIIKTIGELDKVEGIRDPVTMFEIEQLKQALKELVIVCKRFVNAAKSLAQYAMNEEMLSAIEQEITADQPVTDTLSVWLNGIKNQFKRCSVRAAKFDADYKNIVEDVRKTKDVQKSELDAKEKDLEGKQYWASASKNAAIGIATAGAVIGTGIGVGACVATGGLAAPLAAVFFATAASTVAGTTTAGTISANYYAATKFSKAHCHLLEEAIATVSRLHETINALKTEQGKLEGCISDAEENIEMLEGEVDKRQVKKYVLSLNSHLKNVKDNMKTIFDRCKSIDWDQY